VALSANEVSADEESFNSRKERILRVGFAGVSVMSWADSSKNLKCFEGLQDWSASSLVLLREDGEGEHGGLGASSSVVEPESAVSYAELSCTGECSAQR
jgi:hypothetical protein